MLSTASFAVCGVIFVEMIGSRGFLLLTLSAPTAMEEKEFVDDFKNDFPML